MVIQEKVISDHGEVVSEGAKTFKIFDEERGYLFRAKNFFVKSFSDFKLSEFIINKTDFANLHILAENIYKDTNMIGIKIKNKPIPAGIEDIGKLINLCNRRAQDFIDRMMQKGIIAKVIINSEERVEYQFYLNPLFFMSSKYLSSFLFMLFREQLTPYLKPWVLKELETSENLKESKQIQED